MHLRWWPVARERICSFNQTRQASTTKAQHLVARYSAANNALKLNKALSDQPGAYGCPCLIYRHKRRWGLFRLSGKNRR